MTLGVLLALSLMVARAAPPPADEAGLPLAEAWIHLEHPDDLERIRAAGLTLDGRFGDRVRVIAAPPALQRLRAAGFRVAVTREDHRRPPPAGYHDPDAMVAALEDLAEAWPGRVSLVDLGTSEEGRPVVAVRIGSGAPVTRVLGTHHGDETIAGEVALALAQRLATGDGEGEVWIVPHVNPDGVAAGSRYNARGVDLNRNYGYEWQASEYRSGEAPFSETETRRVRAFSAWHPFGLGLSLHAGAVNYCFVWNWTRTAAPDEQLLSSWGDAYEAACPLSGFYVVNGADWYITHGDTTDWSYGARGTLETTIELSREKSPPADEIPEVTAAHLDAMEAYLRRPPTVLGRVVDAVDGAPLEATVTPSGGWPSVAGPDGGFARWLADDVATLEVAAPGYAPATVTLDALGPGVVEVALERSDLRWARPAPVLLSWSDEAQEVDLGMEGTGATLWRPGFSDRTLECDGSRCSVTTSDLEPGPWGVRTEEGVVPRALFVGERSDRVAVERVEVGTEGLVLEGHGFGRGTMAWLVAGPTRVLLEAPVLEASTDRLVVDDSARLGFEDPVDLVIFSAGAQLAVTDLAHGGTVDTGTPGDTGDSGGIPRDSGVPGDSGRGVLGLGGGRCGCAAGANLPAGCAAGLLPVTLATLLGLRRRRNPAHTRLSGRSQRSEP